MNLHTKTFTTVVLLFLVLSNRTPAATVTPVLDQEYLPTLLQLIDEASSTISFLQLEYHYDPAVKQIQAALAKAVERGVQVTGLLEDNIDFNARSVPYLENLGIQVKLDSKKKMLHSKLIVIDKKKTLIWQMQMIKMI